MRGRARFRAVEYEPPAPLASVIAADAHLRPIEARDLLLSAGERARSLLGLESSPLVFVRDGVRFEGVAGVFLIAPGMELEVAPKFLGDAKGWREDFFLIATLDRHGRMLDEEGIRASASASSDLFTLIGRSFVGMYWRNHRRPLRTYKRQAVTQFNLDGDCDALDLLVPGEDGFEQEVTIFTRANAFNAVIGAAAQRLAPLVSDPETRARLERVAQHLPRQPLPARVERLLLPSCARAWQPVYDLAADILASLGGTYEDGRALAPGYLLKTWQAWQSLVSVGLRSAFGAALVTAQEPRVLGQRFLQNGKKVSAVVKPDNIVDLPGRPLVFDAKYKGNVAFGPTAVSNADLYEGLAFAKAAKSTEVVLAYPRRPSEASRGLEAEPPGASAEERAEQGWVGTHREFAHIEVDGVTLRGVEFGVRGISRPHGLRTFGRAFKDYVAGLPEPMIKPTY